VPEYGIARARVGSGIGSENGGEVQDSRAMAPADDASGDGSSPAREAAGSAAPAPDSLRRRLAFPAIAGLLFLLALASPARELLGRDLTRYAARWPRYEGELESRDRAWQFMVQNDLQLSAWLVARNARVLVTHPSTLYDTELCHPAKGMLARGEPMLALGVLGTPLALVGVDPVLLYNAVVLGLVLVSAAGMCWLVVDWTGDRHAGLAAGLLFALHPVKLREVVHPYIDDTVWIVFAMLFARRFFAKEGQGGYAGWASALGFALAVSMQMAGSFYALLGCFFVALPFGVWLLVRHRHRLAKLEPAPAALALAIVGAVGWGVFAPYLELSAEGGLSQRLMLQMLKPTELLPGGRRFPGLVLVALVVAALALGRTRGMQDLKARLGDPRLALLVGAVLAVVIPMAGPRGFFVASPLYLAVAKLIPGMSVIRAPERIAIGLHVATCVLAGIGAAALLRGLPAAWRTRGGAAVVAVAFFAVTVPVAWLSGPPIVFKAVEVRPPESWLRFFTTLEERGNRGPILEIPAQDTATKHRRVGAAIFHGRRTNTCINSYSPPVRAEVNDLADRVPEPAALDRLLELGFTTIVGHHPADDRWPWNNAFARRFEAASRGPGARLRKIHATADHSAFEILPAAR